MGVVKPDGRPEGDAVDGSPVMDCGYVAERHVADLYVLHQLTAEQAERFEDHYMSCETCLDELERAEVMARGFKRVGAEEMAQAAVVTAGAGWWRRRTLPALAATAVVAAVALPYFWSRPSQEAGGRGNTPVVFLQPERSAETVASRRIRRPADRGPVVFVLELAPPFYPSYDAVVERSGQRIWTVEGLELGERDTVALSLDAGLLESGEHVLWLGAMTPEGRHVGVGRFGFRVGD